MGSSKVTVAVSLLAFYAIAFVVFTYPLVLDFDGSFISDGNDGCQFVWNIYNFTDNIEHSKPLFHTDKLYHPVGSSLILHVYAPVFGVVGLLVGNPVLVLNITVALSFVFSGIGAYMLCNFYVRSRPLSALAGFVYAYCPYKLLHIYGHYDLMLTASVPFFIYFFVKSLRQVDGGRRLRLVSGRSLVMALVFFVITYFSSYYYTFFLIIFVLLYISFLALRLYNFRLFTRRNLVYGILIVLASTAVVALFERLGLDRDGLARNGLGRSADMLSFFVPSALSRFLASDAVRYLRLDVIRANQAESTVYVGYGILVFAAGFFLQRLYRGKSPETKALPFMVGCFLVLAMPVVLVADRIVCALPSALIHYVPFVNNFRVPYRYTIMIMLFLPILAGLFIKERLWGVIPKRFHLLFVSALIAVLSLEYVQVPFPMVSRHEVPEVYEYLATQPDGVLLEIPFGLRDGFRQIGDERSIQIYYQTIHHKKILGGILARPKREIFDFFMSEPVVSDLIKMQEDETWDAPVPGPEDVSRFLETFSPRYVLIHPERTGWMPHLTAECHRIFLGINRR